jgi:DNA-binding transcriptional MerR regulator
MTGDAAGLPIGDVAAATGWSVHALRYYEREGLIPQVERDEGGRRRYRPEHLRWIGLLDRLRISGMSVARMREYVRLAIRGDVTAPARRELLEGHARDIRDRIEELRECLAIVEAKVDLYAGRHDARVVWDLVEAANRSRGGRRPPRAGPGSGAAPPARIGGRRPAASRGPPAARRRP